MRLRVSTHLGSSRVARALRYASTAALCVLLAACADQPVNWDPARVDSARGAVVVTPDGALRPDSLAALAARLPPPDTAMCPGSLTLARAAGHLFGAWWHARPDSGAVLLAAHSDDEGRHWSASAPVDTTDVGAAGCSRAPPAIAADSASGYVHVAFALVGKEGPGLFFAHSMDGGASFHAAVPIFYGEKLGRSSVAADGDHVVVAFEDPNSRMPRVGLALSRTMGHIFEERILPISDDNGAATHPRAAIRGRRVAVAWDRSEPSDSAATLVAIRAGTLTLR
jgi:hypothetical protein